MCGCLLHAPNWGPGLATQACALTGNRTGDLLVCGMMHNPLSHTSQGENKYILRVKWLILSVVAFEEDGGENSQIPDSER